MKNRILGSMRRKYLIGPFICCLAVWTYGNGALPLLPLYAMERGASQSISGLFLAFAFLCLASGTFASGMLSKTFRYRRLLIVASGVPMVVLTWLGGRIANVLQLAIVTGLDWLLCGVVLSQTTTLIGLEAEPEDRGMVFGVLGMTNGLGALIGGLTLGYIADRFGYRSIFDILAVFFALVVAGGFFSVEPSVSQYPEPHPGTAAAKSRPIGTLILLLVAQILVAVTNASGNLGRSFAMNTGGFAKSAITLTVAITGLVSLGLPLAAGWLSDWIGRRWALIACFAGIAASLLFLAFSRSLWQFCVFAALYAFLATSQGVGPALVVDIDPAGNVGRGVAFFQSAFWVGSIAAMASSGFAIERFGIATPILISSLFPAAAAVLLLFIKVKARRETTLASKEQPLGASTRVTGHFTR